MVLSQYSTICGSPQDLAAALKIIEEDGPWRGLHVNRSKSLLYIPPDDDPSNNMLPSGIPFSTTGFSLLGVPLGSDLFREVKVFDRVENIRIALEIARPCRFTGADYSPTLVPVFTKIQLFSPDMPSFPDFERDTLFDNLIREALEDITGGPLSDWSWAKANLPCSMGG